MSVSPTPSLSSPSPSPYGGPARRIMLWSAPRTISTAVERVILESGTVDVVHEPFGIAYYWSDDAPSKRCMNDPRCEETYESLAQYVYWDDIPEDKNARFIKDHAYYVADHPGFVDNLDEICGPHTMHAFIVRHPAKAIRSLYMKSCVDNKETKYTYFDPKEAGFEAMHQILKKIDSLRKPGDPEVVIMDADDFLEDPKTIMGQFCHQLSLPFSTSMLSWDAGKVDILQDSRWTGWTDHVQVTNGIIKRDKRSPIPGVSDLPKLVQETIAKALPLYDEFHARRSCKPYLHRPSTSSSESSSSPRSSFSYSPSPSDSDD